MRRLTRVLATAIFAAAVLVLIGTGTPLRASISGGQNGFLLGGTAQNALDPENSSNQVIRINTTPPPECSAAGGFTNCPAGTVSRHLDAKITQLDNLLEFKSYFLNRSCGGGSPRIQLLIDVNGDGMADGNAFGYTAPPFAGCPPNRWQYDDLTDELPRWDASQLVASGFPSALIICSNPLFAANPAVCPFQTHSGYIPWNVFETVLATVFPLHTVCSGALVDDSSWMAGASGVAYYDVISIGKATWTNWGDTAGRGFARGCVEPDHDDDHHDGDDNHDHKVDDGDRDWRERRN